MKSSILLLSSCLCASITFAQSTSPQSQSSHPATNPSSATSSSGSTSQLKPRGPEAIAEVDPNRVVATMGGKQITAKQAADMLKALTPADRKKYEGNLAAVVQQLYMTDQISGEAAKLGLDQQDPWKEQLRLARANILTQAYLTKMGTASTGPMADEAKRYYDAHPSDFDQVKLAAIEVTFSPPGTPAASGANARTEAQAQDKVNEVEKKIKAGGEFATLARTDSDNQQTATRGGDLSALSVEQLPPDIKNAVSKLQPNQVSEPVRTNGGFWIFKLESRTKVPLDQVRPNIVQKLQLDKYKIQVQDPDFFNASAAQHIPSLQRPTSGAAPQPGH